MSVPNRIARLNADGSTDTSFDPGTGLNAAGHAVAALADGRVVAGGIFTAAAGTARQRLAIFDEDGALDDAAIAANAAVRALAVQTDGKVLVAGEFTTLGGVSRNRAGRLTAALELEAAYDPNCDAAVYAVANQADGKTYVGGAFANVGGVARARLARLLNDDAAGTLSVETAALVTWLRGGSAPETERVTFEISTDSGATWSDLGGAVARTAGGWQVSGLTLSGAGQIRARAYPTDSRSAGIVEATCSYDDAPEIEVTGDGDFGEVQVGQTVDRSFVLANLSRLGVLTLSDDPPAVFAVGSSDNFSIVTQPAGTIAAQGQGIVTVRFAPTSAGVKNATLSIANDDSDEDPAEVALTGEGQPGPGGVDEDWQVVLNGPVYAVAPTRSGIWIGGAFTTVNAVTQKSVAFLTAGGVLTALAISAFNNRVTGLAMLPDGKVMVCGDFTSPRTRLARLNANGTLDSSFTVAVNGSITAMVAQQDGAVVICGTFTTVKGAGRNGLARVKADGTVDAGLNPNVPGGVWRAALQADGKLLISANSPGPAGFALARYNTDGSRDTSYAPDSTLQVCETMAPGPNETLHVTAAISGTWAVRRLTATGAIDDDWTPLSVSSPYSHATVLVAQADGRLLAGYRNAANTATLLVRLDASGAADNGFASPFAGSLYALALDPDGQIFAAGFAAPPIYLARLLNDTGAAVDELVVNSASVVSWERGGTAAEAQDVAFELSQDGGVTWQNLGRGVRQTNGWILSGLNLPVSGQVRGRARLMEGPWSGALHAVTVTIPSGLPVADLQLEAPQGSVLADGSGTLDFPGVQPPAVAGGNGQVVDVTVWLYNPGNASLTNIAAAIVTGDWLVVSAPPTTLAAGQVGTMVLRFKPQAVGARTGVLSVTSAVPGSKNPYVLSLTGSGITLPAATTQAASLITTTTARLNANVKANHDAGTGYFRWRVNGTTNWNSTAAQDVAGFNATAINANLTGLVSGTAYQFQAVASNSLGTVYGSVLTFVTA